MPPRRKTVTSQQLMEFEWGKITDHRGEGFYNRAIAARVQRNSSRVIQIWKKCTEEDQTTRKYGSEPQMLLTGQ